MRKVKFTEVAHLYIGARLGRRKTDGTLGWNDVLTGTARHKRDDDTIAIVANFSCHSISLGEYHSPKPLLRKLHTLRFEDFQQIMLEEGFLSEDTDKEPVFMLASDGRNFYAGVCEKLDEDDDLEYWTPQERLNRLDEADSMAVYSLHLSTSVLCFGMMEDYQHFVEIEQQARWHSALRKRGFDVDGLITAGEAIDASTIMMEEPAHAQ